MMPLTLHEIAIATSGELLLPPGMPETTVVDGPVVTDSRQCGPGGLYIARVGESADGHGYLPQAATKGAIAALVQRPVGSDEIGEAAQQLAQIVVADTEVAFGLLARAAIEAAGPQLTVLAITGSSGKTSTKDLLAHVLATHGPTVAAQESFNSEIGVPLTVCRITPETRYLVVEMGARGIGHVRYLTTIAPPDIALVLNVGYAHAGEFGSLEAVQQAKSELIAGLGEGELAVLNADDARVAAMAPLAWADGAEVAYVSAGGEEADPPDPVEPAVPADEDEVPMSERVDVLNAPHGKAWHVWAENVTLDESGRASFDLHVSGLTGVEPTSHTVQLQLVGQHQVGNALSVAAAALRTGMAVPEIAAALSSATAASRWRMEVSTRVDGVTVVNDAYNANPNSMAAALNALAAMHPGYGGRRIAVLGTMLELGPESDDLHAGVGRLAAELGLNKVIAVGEGAKPLALAAGDIATWVPTADAAMHLLSSELHSGDIALFKSSRDSGLRWLGDQVAADAPALDDLELPDTPRSDQGGGVQ